MPARPCHVDDDIIYFYVCPDCRKRHPPFATQGTHPSVPPAQEKVVAVNSSARERRTPTKIMPFFPPNIAIQRMMRRPAKSEECAHWKTAENIGPQPPVSQDEWFEGRDMNAPLQDVHDGWRWRNIPLPST
ncbi:hypothetical protein R3P38DRAFT_3218191 [Favolaschia claudopus]|uniref:Uncharacterized protein n=1 Tax=Favolaschia claudopus TaxID=2862362 RepID=A0AAW0A495_9AGAR